MRDGKPGPKLVLASTSKYRAQLLARIGIGFIQSAPCFDERAYDDQLVLLGPEELAKSLARGKAESIVENHRGMWILASDQLALLPGTPPVLLHKPISNARAVDQLMSLAGREHQLFTAVVVISGKSRQVYSAVDRQSLTMRSFKREEAQAYIDDFAPLDCAGSYRIEDAGLRLFDHIEGQDSTGTAIVGLPLLIVQKLLTQSGFFNLRTA